MSQVMQEARQKALIFDFGVATFSLGDAPRQSADAPGVPHQFLQGKLPNAWILKLRKDLDRENQRAEGGQTQVKNGLAHVGDRLKNSKKGRVRKLKDLAGHSEVLGNYFADALDRGFLGAELGSKSRMKRRQAGKAGNARDDPFEFLIGQQPTQGKGPLEGSAKFVRIARFGKILVGRADESENCFTVCMSREHEADGVRVTYDHVGEQLGAIHSSHHHIGHDHLHRGAAHELQCLGTGVDEMHIPFVSHPAQLALQPLQHPGLIVHEQHGFHTRLEDRAVLGGTAPA